MNALVVLNLLLTTAVLAFLAWPKVLKPFFAKFRKSTLKPIKHAPIVEGPEAPLVVHQGRVDQPQITTTYWRPKDQSDAEPFMATHYPLPNEQAETLAPDIYVLDRGGSASRLGDDESDGHVSGEEFRRLYEQANVVKVIGMKALYSDENNPRPIAKARNRDTVKVTNTGEEIRGIPAGK